MVRPGDRRMGKLPVQHKRGPPDNRHRVGRVAVDVLVTVGALLLAAPIEVDCLGRRPLRAWGQCAARSGTADGCLLLGKGRNRACVAARTRQAEKQTGK